MPRRGLESTPVDPIRGDCDGFPEVNTGATDREMPISIKPELSQTVLILGSLWLVTALGSSAAISRSRHDSTPTASFDGRLVDLLWPQPPLTFSSHQNSTLGPLIPVVAAPRVAPPADPSLSAVESSLDAPSDTTLGPNLPVP
ncbi:hypothetical protein EMIHUDRAFT_239519 [Emiliania huxleyi CCMP1516]|uniref:Uncharacterized protein n=2 Tax=Emiliania huxleyi TaxID=2903 RepID=A0A0D3JJ45_EMIH1|nr:hypothetical protein EMIHUDRAFT_239519 [Emiliania huxleyi CCMP1516]EOD23530.1 hypothetical protein EMIHUDRAFT_239519 [Emiliania huxleyi CCMP1516]|eukprot:XP_005775959.1 hypothetical protein EMIHUDRAFT_239519 [Emiliania huxleyi CCMP1516]